MASDGINLQPTERGYDEIIQTFQIVKITWKELKLTLFERRQNNHIDHFFPFLPGNTFDSHSHCATNIELSATQIKEWCIRVIEPD